MKGWRMSCDIGEAKEGLENEPLILQAFSRMSQLILQPFRCFTYITAHFPTLPLLHLHHSSFSKPSFASPMSPGMLPMVWLGFPLQIPTKPSLRLRSVLTEISAKWILQECHATLNGVYLQIQVIYSSLSVL